MSVETRYIKWLFRYKLILNASTSFRKKFPNIILHRSMLIVSKKFFLMMADVNSPKHVVMLNKR